MLVLIIAFTKPSFVISSGFILPSVYKLTKVIIGSGLLGVSPIFISPFSILFVRTAKSSLVITLSSPFLLWKPAKIIKP